MRGNFSRIAFVVLCAIATYLYWQHQEKVFENKGRMTVSQEANAVVLTWQADINVPMARRLEEAYADWRDRTKTFILELNSPGGSLREGNRVIELINAMKNTHQVVTRVGQRGMCLSMCVPIYLQGEKRFASASSRWLFHEPRFVDYYSGEENNGPEFERKYFSEQFFRRYFVNSEINPKWRDRLEQEWIGQGVWRSGQQLVDEGSNIVTELH